MGGGLLCRFIFPGFRKIFWVGKGGGLDKEIHGLYDSELVFLFVMI